MLNLPALILGFSLVSNAAPTTDDSPLAARYAELTQAITASDYVRVRAILTDDFTSRDVQGKREGIKAWISDLESAANQLEHEHVAITIHHVDPNEAGYTADVTYDVTGTSGNHQVEVTSHEQEAWVNLAGTWRLRMQLDIGTVERVDGKVIDDQRAPDSQTPVPPSLRSYLQREHIPGAVVGIAREGAPPTIMAYGVTDLETRTPVTERTQFEIGSMTKTLTAAAVLQLVDRKKLALDDPVSTYLPWLTRAAHISIRELLDQTSGLVLFGSDLNTIASDFPSGTRWEYSNVNYLVLGHVVESVSGEEFQHYVRSHIFAPAQMTHSAFISDEASLNSLATGYWHEDGKSGPLDTAAAFGESRAGAAGDVVSTVDDMLAFDETLACGNIIQAADFAAMTRKQRLTGGSEIAYGLGWFVTQYHGSPLVLHGGTTNGFSGTNMLFPQQHVAVVVLTNLGSIDNAIMTHIGLGAFDRANALIE